MLNLELIAAGHHLRDLGEADTGQFVDNSRLGYSAAILQFEQFPPQYEVFLGPWGAQAGEKRRVEMVGIGCVSYGIGWHVDCVYAKFDFHPKVWYSAAR